jgi:hypothetical protein
MLTIPLRVGYGLHMRCQFALGFLSTGVVLAGTVLMIACDTEPASENNLRVEPARVRIAKGSSQQFTASGGFSQALIKG